MSSRALTTLLCGFESNHMVGTGLGAIGPGVSVFCLIDGVPEVVLGATIGGVVVGFVVGFVAADADGAGNVAADDDGAADPGAAARPGSSSGANAGSGKSFASVSFGGRAAMMSSCGRIRFVASG